MERRGFKGFPDMASYYDWKRKHDAEEAVFGEHYPTPKDTDPLEKAADERFNRLRAQYSPNLLRSPI